MFRTAIIRKMIYSVLYSIHNSDILVCATSHSDLYFQSHRCSSGDVPF